MKFELRDYQIASVEAALDSKGNPLLELATGAGKSIINAELNLRLIQAGRRVLNLTHVKELVQQNSDRFEAHSGITPGVCCAGLGVKSMDGPSVFGSVQTVVKNFGDGEFDDIIVDECHLISSKEGSRYDQVQKRYPDARWMGLSATPWRLDNGSIIGNSPLDIHAHKVGMGYLIDRGFLIPPVGIGADSEVNSYDLKRSSSSGGDLNATGRLLEVVNDNVDEIIHYAGVQGRKRWLVFCSSIEHATLVYARFVELGISSGLITSKTKAKDRDAILDSFKRGSTTCLVNPNTLTTGVDVPEIDLIAIVRCLASSSLYVQISGRAARPYPGLKDFLLLDFGGNIERHGPVTDPLVFSTISPESTPGRKCEHCRKISKFGSDSCEHCGALWPEPEEQIREIYRRAGKVPPISIAPRAKVSQILARKMPDGDGGHKLRIRYIDDAGVKIGDEYLCPEMKDWRRPVFCGTWLERGGCEPVPRTVDAALDRWKEEMGRPTEIQDTLEQDTWSYR